MALLYEAAQSHCLDIYKLFALQNLRLFLMAPRDVFKEIEEPLFQLPTVFGGIVLDYHFDSCDWYSEQCDDLYYEYEVLTIQDKSFARIDEFEESIESKLLEIMEILSCDAELFGGEHENDFELDYLYELRSGEILPYFKSLFLKVDCQMEIALYRTEEIPELVQCLIDLKRMLEE